ncbi:MAG TPA: amidohydrolase family protein [Actinophytocola sp.]|uniref:amidohydrolase family protein n=1 Tax=Actinophytocola sp. TaxID=1872138 RepID=UPI002DDD555F|nr:amidohydrolase family protein [Actinophytocola sp.]HEV2784543.1 amidohydrolase family protein [Actinophytocola sp.]
MVDAHHHLWDPRIRDYPWMSGTALAPIRRPYTVDDLRSVIGPEVSATVLVQTVSSTAETEEFLAAASGSGGLIAGVVGWVDLTAPDIPADPLLVGVRHQVEDEPDPEWLLHDDVLRGLRAVGAADLVYDLLVRAPQRPAALEVVRRLPDVRFVLDHAGKPGIATGEGEPWASWITDLAALPNVVCKLSGLVTEATWDAWTADDIRPYAEHVLSAFGADRVMFGSDWPVCELAGSYAEVLKLTHDLLDGASASERAAVLAGTARRTYRL